MDADTKREWWKGEIAAGALVISLLGLAGSTFNLSMNVGRFVENTDVRFQHIEDYIKRDVEIGVTQMEKAYILDKISSNTAELKDCREKTRDDIVKLHAKVDRLLKEFHSHGE